jgi:hypothetical protein
MKKVSRRGFLSLLAAATATAATAAVDPEKLLWEPGKRTIFIPEVVVPKNAQAPLDAPKSLITDAAQAQELFNRMQSQGMDRANPHEWQRRSRRAMQGGEWEIESNVHERLLFDADWRHLGNPKDLAEANRRLARFFPEVKFDPNHDTWKGNRIDVAGGITLGGGKALTKDDLRERQAQRERDVENGWVPISMLDVTNHED